jgi:hypothetical protein
VRRKTGNAQIVASVLLTILVLSLGLTGFVFAAPATSVLWGDSSANEISSKNISSGSTVTNVTGATNVNGIAVDDAAGKVYWVSGTKIERADFAGTNREDVITGLSGPYDIALDVANDLIYWTDQVDGKVQRCSTTSVPCTAADVATGLDTPYGIALDPGGNEIYWGDDGTFKIQKCDPAACSTPTDVLTGLNSVDDIALDLANAKIYWVDYWAIPAEIHRDSLAGGNNETLYTFAGTGLASIALDVDDNKLYWGEINAGAGNDVIRHAALDGSSPADYVTGLDTVSGLALSSVSTTALTVGSFSAGANGQFRLVWGFALGLSALSAGYVWYKRMRRN